MKNILIITQKVNIEDDLLGFFVGWLNQFSKNFDKVFVITLEKGIYDLPANVFVYSLGKEKNNSKIVRFFNFYRYLFKLVPQSIGIFAHMSPIFVIASWPSATIFRKKIVLWYLHRSVTFRLKVAEKLCYKIVTAAKESLKFNSSKIIETGHGISFSDFKTERNWSDNKLKILSVGRISKIKDYEILLESAKILKDKGLEFQVKIIGQPIMVSDFEYQKFLISLQEKLGLKELIEFVGFIPYNYVVEYYKEANLVIGLTPHGGIDKTILEGMASGCLVLTSNDANRRYFGHYADELVFNHHDPVHLAHKIESLNRMPIEQKKEMSNFLVESVAKYHNLTQTIERISSLFNHD
ncbi:MAG: glycosyltransferase family 4 protein [bacterium]|nr:glycosyltransferase family 4 protein [bacterium]